MKFFLKSVENIYIMNNLYSMNVQLLERKLPLGFKKVKSMVIKCLQNGDVKNEYRDYSKNLLAVQLIDYKEAIKIIKSCTGNEYSCSKHHQDPNIDVHILKPIGKYDGYYIKFYFVDPNTVFISFHTETAAS